MKGLKVSNLRVLQSFPMKAVILQSQVFFVQPLNESNH